MASVFVILSAFPNKESAEVVSKRLIESRAAACVQLLSATSNYIWKGKAETAEEMLLVAKTGQQGLRRVLNLITENHPYELPELLYFEVHSSEDYASWVEQTTKL